jgi:hypothetical protein
MASSAIEGAAEVHIKSVQVNRITSKAKLDRFMVDYILNQIDDPEEAEFEVHWLNEGPDITEVLIGLRLGLVKIDKLKDLTSEPGAIWRIPVQNP